ncbi:MAG: DUF6968 family protein [Cellvibrionaceae bacterium]
MTQPTLAPFLSRVLDSTTGKIVVTIDQPQEDKEGNWLTNYTIADKKQHVYGSDSIQSLMIALERIKNELETHHKDARWGEFDNHGFSLQVPFFINSDIQNSIKDMIDNELEKPATYK